MLCDCRAPVIVAATQTRLKFSSTAERRLWRLLSQGYLFWTVVVSTRCSVLCFLSCLLLQPACSCGRLNAQTHTLYMCDVTAMNFHKRDHFGFTTLAVSKEAPLVVCEPRDVWRAGVVALKLVRYAEINWYVLSCFASRYFAHRSSFMDAGHYFAACTFLFAAWRICFCLFLAAAAVQAGANERIINK